MSVYGWYNNNEMREYPIDERAVGNPLPTHVLADACIRWPATLGDLAFISALTISKTLVTLLVQVGETPIGSVAVRRRGAIYRPIILESLVPGAGGWVLFGEGVEDNELSVFGSEESTPLVNSAAMPYTALGLPGVTVTPDPRPLTGIVDLVPGPGLAIYAAKKPRSEEEFQVFVDQPEAFRILNGEEQSGIVLRVEADPTNFHLLRDLAGDCAGFPDTYCDRRTIKRINNVSPDCDGNINIELVGVPPRYIGEGGEVAGLLIDYFLGLSDICHRDPIRLARPPVDLCDPDGDLAFSSPFTPQPIQPIPPAPIPSSEEPDEPIDEDCIIDEPIFEMADELENLDCYSPNDGWQIEAWSVVSDVGNIPSANLLIRQGSETLFNDVYGYMRLDTGSRGGMILGYEDRRTFSYLCVDREANRFRIFRLAAGRSWEVASRSMSSTMDDWIKIRSLFTPNGARVTAQFWMNDMLLYSASNFAVQNGNVGFAHELGRMGVYALGINEDIPFSSSDAYEGE